MAFILKLVLDVFLWNNTVEIFIFDVCAIKEQF